MIEAIRNGTFVKFQAINRGKSPARVIFFGESPNFDTPLYSEETWNPVPHYGYGYDIEGAEIINIPWIAPGDTPWVFSTYDLRVLEEFDPARHTECATGARAVYLWHTVKYKGLSGTTIYESRFCYQAINGKLKMAGPYGLNQYT
jgi:hypothetical protein